MIIICAFSANIYQSRNWCLPVAYIDQDCATIYISSTGRVYDYS